MEILAQYSTVKMVPIQVFEFSSSIHHFEAFESIYPLIFQIILEPFCILIIIIILWSKRDLKYRHVGQ